MPRIVWNDTAEAGGSSPALVIHYQSPHEFLKDLAPGVSPERLFVPTERSLPAGAHRPVILHIGFVARELRLNARVETVTTAFESRTSGKPAEMSLTLLGPDGAASPELRDLIKQLQQGLACQAAAGNTATTDERLPKDRQLLKMPATLKMMHAIKADLEDRLILAGDADPRSIEFLLKNPGITLPEIRTISARPTLITAHIQTILANRGWSADDRVRLNLARNPRLPDMFVESLLESLSLDQLKIVAGSTTITTKTKRIAHRILEARGH
ncbi:MAG TPA: hypothetical protein VFQ07_06230 [Candidatus Polarisedimenticolia bacterium]|nr:hypothetical protein [Candidatus Polarisedimenticolia bacterium]